MSLSNTLRLYLLNARIAISFLLLLAFVLPLLQFKQIFQTSGTLFLDYNFINIDTATLLPVLLLIILFLLVYSILITSLVFGVRKALSVVKLHYYLSEQLTKFAFKYFVFLFLFSVGITVFASALFLNGAPMLTVNFLIFLFSLAFMFVAQSIVVDEVSLPTAIKLNFEYIYKNFDAFLYVAAVSTVAVFTLSLIEFVFDYFFMSGWVISILIAMLFVIPFTEVLKTQFYMNKFDLIKISEKMLAKHRKYKL